MKRSLSATEFAAVFEKGKTFFAYPIKMVADVQPVSIAEQSDFKVAFAVPKRLVKRATRRNRIKRQMRAAFQKYENVVRGTILADAKKCHLIFMYSDTQKDITIRVLEDAICKNVKTLVDNIK